MSVLSLENVRKTYRRGGIFGGGEALTVLDGVDLELNQGQCLGLVGRSGCGKSTMGRLALGLERPDSGTVRYKGQDIRSLKGAAWRDFRRNVQVVFQNFTAAVNPRMTAGEIVAEPLRNFERLGEASLRAKVGELLEQVGLAPADAGKLPAQFSGGQLQRVCIARAIALSPEVLVLDESVSSLDMLVQAQVLDLVASLGRERGASCLFISHDLRVVARACSEAAVMRSGRIVERAACGQGRFDLCDEGFSQLAGAILPARPGPRPEVRQR